ncbi:unnamed protein product [Discula destructiva]
MSIPPETARYEWILVLTTFAFIFSAFGNGANDIANNFATIVASRVMTMTQVGFVAMGAEFLGATLLGARVTDTIKNGIIPIDRFVGNPGAYMLAMGCAELGSAAWLMIATRLGFPTSTTQTIVGALIGVGLATQSPITWQWGKGSVSQIAASWGVSPVVAAVIAAILFGSIKYGVLERKDSLKWALRLIPFYFATTGAILALFLVVEAPTAPSLEEFGVGRGVGIILGVWAGILLFSYVFMVPYLERRMIFKDTRLRYYHIPLGPLLRMENPPIYWPAKAETYVTDFYEDAYQAEGKTDKQTALEPYADAERPNSDPSIMKGKTPNNSETKRIAQVKEAVSEDAIPSVRQRKVFVPPYERYVGPVENFSWFSPLKWWGWIKFLALHGVTVDVLSYDSKRLRDIHSRGQQYDIRVEHLFTYCQVISAVMMSVAHGSNDIANAVGPWVAVYETYRTGDVETEAPTPVWFLAIAAIILGLGFWIYGYHIVRAFGNKITLMSPTRGFAIELGTATTVLMASRLGLPISSTQCLTGSVIGVALMNYDLKAVNWRQIGWFCLGWLCTMPAAGLIAGLPCLMAFNTPNF